jgi:hypothetical protein
MSDSTQLFVLVCIVAAFAAFGVTLFAVSTYANLSERRSPKPLPRAVVPASRRSAPVIQ